MLDDVLTRYDGIEVSAIDMYSDIFHLGDGYIQCENEPNGLFKANPIGYWKNNNDDKGHFRILFEDTFEDILKEMQKADFSLLNCVTYFGRKRSQEHASKMYAMIFDLDGLDDEKLNNFLNAAYVADVYPIPNYICLSGHNVHLYYVFEEPIDLYPNIRLQLKEFKYALTSKIWNRYTSALENVQMQGIFQAFRVVGGKTKEDAKYKKVRAFRLNEHPFDLEQLGRYIPDEHKVDSSKVFKETTYTLDDAKKKFPEWYEKVVLNKDKSVKPWDIKGKVHGDDPYALYHWWLWKIKHEATFGHRYFCIMALAIYAIKNDVPKMTLKEDAYSLIDLFNSYAPEHPFTKTDVDSALECFNEQYRTFPRNDISHLCAIEIVKNKRNGRKQSVHLEIARATQSILDKQNGNDWRDGNGRKSKENIVKTWQLKHPEGTKAECNRQTGLDPKTIRKWWNESI